MSTEFLYLDTKNPPQEYYEMLETYHKDKWERFKRSQFSWYQKWPYFRVFCLKNGEQYVGQASAFRVDAFINQKIEGIWWGVDTFLFKEYRGGGKGKYLQKQLHEDLQNFTSAAYTPINGIIKKKCGCKELFTRNTYYYAVSNYCILMASIFADKKLKRQLPVKSISSYCYSIFRRKRYKHFTIEDARIDETLVSFINNTLSSNYDFFVWRSVDYLKWKYAENPAFNYKLLSFRFNGKIEAIVGFTDIHEYSIGGKKVRSVKILDSVIVKDSSLTQKDVLVYVADYYKRKHEKLDGIFSLISCNWFPKIRISRPVLSTINQQINKPYLTYLDQDMEQVM